MSNKFKTVNHRRTTWEYESPSYHIGRGSKFTVETAEAASNKPFTNVSFWSNDPSKLTRGDIVALTAMLKEVALTMVEPVE